MVLERSRLVRIFAIYMVFLYLWASYLEPRVVLHCDKPYSVFLGKKFGIGIHNVWYSLFITPSILYIIVALMIAPLSINPGLIERRRYAKLLAYALAPFATAWISGALSFCPCLDELYEFTSSRLEYLAWFTLGYPLAYVIYAYLVYRIFDPMTREVDISGVMPRFYRASTLAARILGLPLLVFSVVTLLFLAARIVFGMFGVLIYPAIGLYLTGSKVKDKPYRFLIALPLFGQAACWRAFLFDLGVLINNLLAGGPVWIIPDAAARIIAPLSLTKWMLFPIPGFGGAQASLALVDFLEYKLYGELSWITSPPTFITSLWLFGEWLMFYKALSSALRKQ